MYYLNHLVRNSSNQIVAFINETSENFMHLKHTIVQDQYNIKQFIYTEEVITKKIINKNIIKSLRQKYAVNFFVLDNIFLNMKDLYSYICFGLIYGESVQDIAKWLNISRSYVNKIITEKINPMLNIPGSSSKLLLDKLIHLEFYRYIPYNLIYLQNDIPQNNNNINQIVKQTEILSSIQKKIVDMLLNNHKQNSIAEEIGISRSYVSKIIHKQLCPLFNIKSENSSTLIKLLKSSFNIELK
jgi:predicted XRE-type DNA-binding protein